jgi:hypothetical protein
MLKTFECRKNHAPKYRITGIERINKPASIR